MSASFLLPLLFVCAVARGQAYVRPNEEVILSFRTTKGRLAYIVKDKKDAYIAYRYGTPGKVEFQYPEVPDSSSWKKFVFSWYRRGGGIQNEGLELNYLVFVNKGTRYVVSDSYRIADKKPSLRILVINEATKKETVIPALYKTRKGSLAQLRDNDLIAVGEDLYD
jgi:hypothetical protein